MKNLSNVTEIQDIVIKEYVDDSIGTLDKDFAKELEKAREKVMQLSSQMKVEIET